MSPPVGEWAQAFVLTLLIEGPIYGVGLRRAGLPWTQVLALILGVNLVTHPALWYVMPRFSPYWAWVLVAETGVTLTEGALIARQLGWARGLGLAVLANTVSTVMGLWVV